MKEQEKDFKWYVVQTYAGNEDKVKANIERRVEIMGVKDYVAEVLVPKEKVEVERKVRKKGKVEVVKKEEMKPIYPGYVMVCMVLNDETWKVVRGTPGVTGFVGGTAGKPVPLTEKEVTNIMKKIGRIQQERSAKFVLREGDRAKVIKGPFEGFEGIVKEVDVSKSKVKLLLKVFGRDTLVELNFSELEKVRKSS